MIVATAGHIDHGKTLLVKALTGVDTDRLPDEKRRGLSIDIGFAYRHADDGTALGFVDVPGHERFIRNMLAGVAGVDFALLVVAADDGPMPQTIEHLAVLDLLGIGRGAVALSKVDRVPAERAAEAAAAIRDVLAESVLADAPIFKISAVTGEGVRDLDTHLWEQARRFRRENRGGGFRLAIDRAFKMTGSGVVVTGTVFAGSVRVGDRLVHSPTGDEVRVRTIHAYNRPTESGVAGDRCAVNLAGADLRRNGIGRGDWLVSPDLHAPTDRIDARFRVLASATRPIRHWTPVHLHLGAADVEARIAVLEGREIAPGGVGPVQFVLEREIVALYGDRLIARDIAVQATLGGGFVIDPWPPQRGRRRPERLRALTAMAGLDPVKAFANMLIQAPSGIDLDTFARARNLAPETMAAIQADTDSVSVSVAGRRRAVPAERWRVILADYLTALADHHRAVPGGRGMSPEAIRPRGVSKGLAAAAVDELIAAGKIRRDGGLLALAGTTSGDDTDDAMWSRVRPLMTGNSLHPETVHELARRLELSPGALGKFLARMARKGRVVAVADNRFYDAGVIAELGLRVEALAKDRGGTLTVAGFRDGVGVGRNLAIDLLEYFDRAGFTRRVGDARHIVRSASTVFASNGNGAAADR